MDAPTKPAPQTEPLFREEQRFRQGWLWALLAGTGAVAGLSLGVPLYEHVAGSAEGWAEALAQDPGLLGGAGIGVATLAGVAGLVAAAKLVVEVWPGAPPESTSSRAVGALCVRFRGLFVDREIPLSEIERAEAVAYSPLKDYGGWGLRHGPAGKAYNVSGDRGVRLTLAGGHTLMTGSQRAEALAAAIRQARGRR
jgi:hypothetical protein